jgi:subtilisin family serine protease
MKAILLFAILCFVPLAFSKATLRLAGDPSKVVPDQYMVMLQKNTTVAMRDAHISNLLAASSRRFGGVKEEVSHRWHVTLSGYAGKFNKETIAELLNDPLVELIEQDQIVTITDTTEEQIQVDPAAWGLRRVDQFGDFYFNEDTYTYWASAGTGVDAYIIDTGILLTHQDFQGRAIFGINAVTGETDSDCNGHGTHVASTTGGFDYGLAKKVTLIAVKVLGCGGSGTWAGVVTGVEWTTSSYQTRNKPSVANMSLGGGVTAIADTAVANSIAAGVHYAIAAGNSNADACNFSPARVPAANTVGATTYALNANPNLPSTDSRATFSNVGTCLDIFAPGQNIKAAWIGSNTATSTISGTSMASPHVAGAIAVRLGHLLADSLPIENPAQLTTFLKSVASPNRLANPGTGSPNLLLYSPYA